MPSVRFSRDKRGYEYVYLVHTTARRGKPGRSRVLYWYRTPPGVRVGRKPFDEEVRRTLEQQNPGVTFDWEAIVNTPMPPPDMTEFWRERRRAEKAARQERRAMEADDASVTAEPEQAPTSDVAEETSEAAGESAAADLQSAAPTPAAPGENAEPAADGALPRKKRRRRGGRKRRLTTPDAGASESASTSAAEPALEQGQTSESEDMDDQSDGPDPTSEGK